jgi:5-methylcytosine-specific restriction endonuclease McrA
MPVSKGGKTTWDNCVTACGPCNADKADKTHTHKPKVKPYKPDYYELVNKRKKLPFHVRHDEWLQFIL